MYCVHVFAITSYFTLTNMSDPIKISASSIALVNFGFTSLGVECISLSANTDRLTCFKLDAACRYSFLLNDSNPATKTMLGTSSSREFGIIFCFDSGIVLNSFNDFCFLSFNEVHVWKEMQLPTSSRHKTTHFIIIQCICLYCMIQDWLE